MEDGLHRASFTLDSRRESRSTPPHSPTTLSTSLSHSRSDSPTNSRAPSSFSTSSSVMSAGEEQDDLFSEPNSISNSNYTSPPSSTGDSPILRATDLKSAVPVILLDTRQSTGPTPPLPVWNLVILMSRLYEAHFNLGYLFILLTLAPYFNPGLEPTPLWKLRPTTVASTGAQQLDSVVLFATAVAAQLGTFAFICTALIFFYYEKFHHITTTKRWEGKTHLGQRANQQSIRTFPSCLITYAAVPFTLVFGILPLYHAQASHIISNRLTVSLLFTPYLFLFYSISILITYLCSSYYSTKFQLNQVHLLD